LRLGGWLRWLGGRLRRGFGHGRQMPPRLRVRPITRTLPGSRVGRPAERGRPRLGDRTKTRSTLRISHRPKVRLSLKIRHRPNVLPTVRIGHGTQVRPA
jgi:hypothetical protein